MLSERIRPDVEAAPGVIDEVKKLESDNDRLCQQNADLLKMLNQMLDDMGATGHSVCGAVKAMGRYVLAQYQTDKEAFLDYTIHQAVKVLLEVDMISEEQAKTAIAKATGGETRRMGQLTTLNETVDRAMRESNLRIEGKVDGRWVPIEQAPFEEDVK